MELLHAIDRRLNNVEFIRAPADETYFNELRDRVRSLDPNVPLPGSNEPFAWRRTFEAYENALRQGPQTRPQPAPYVDPVAAYIKDWREYHSNRSLLLSMAQRQGLEEADVGGFLGLEHGDLSKKFEPADFRNPVEIAPSRKEWGAAADRVDRACRDYRPLTDEQFAIHFLLFTNKQLASRIEELESKLNGQGLARKRLGK